MFGPGGIGQSVPWSSFCPANMVAVNGKCVSVVGNQIPHSIHHK